MKNNLNILIVCEHASNVFGGEAMLPLNYFRLLSRTSNNVYLITHERVRRSLEKIQELDLENIYYISDSNIYKTLYRLSRMLPHRISVVTTGALLHFLTQFHQRKLAKKIIKEKAINIVHEPAPVSATQPSAMFGLNVPIVIGPMNGGMLFPKAFSHMAGAFEKYLYKGIRVISSLFNLVMPGKRNAALLLVANKRTALALPKFMKGSIAELVENGVFNVKKQPNTSGKSHNINVIYVGRLVDWKCVDIAIEAISKTKTNATLTIIGDGDERLNLESYVNEKQIKNINFQGMVAHKDINLYYDDADAFILPSIRECGGAVVLEAMSRGLPVIATNWGGPADYITPQTGYLVEPLSRDYMVSEFARIIDELSANPELRHRIGAAAITRIEQHFLWQDKINKIIEYYHHAISR